MAAAPAPQPDPRRLTSPEAMRVWRRSVDERVDFVQAVAARLRRRAAAARRP